MDIADWRKKIDELDRRLVELLSQRAQALERLTGGEIAQPLLGLA